MGHDADKPRRRSASGEASRQKILDAAGALAEAITTVVGRLELLLCAGMGPNGAPGLLAVDERAVLDRALHQTYAAAGITPDTRRISPVRIGLSCSGTAWTRLGHGLGTPGCQADRTHPGGSQLCSRSRLSARGDIDFPPNRIQPGIGLVDEAGVCRPACGRQSPF